MTKAGWLLSILVFSTACSNDFDINAPYRDVPLVYCVLDPGDSVHYLRLGKTFLGEASAYEMARHPDTIYYPEASVVLERRENQMVKEEYTFEPVNYDPREPGIFIEDPNPLYMLARKLQAGYEYRLRIKIPSKTEEISSITHLVDQFRITKPEYFRTSLPFSSYDNHLEVEWITARYTRIYHLRMRFHYLEVNGNDTSALYADWNIANFSAEDDGGDIMMETHILHRNFYKWIGNKLDSIGNNTTRLARREGIELWFTVGGDELFTYLQVNRPDDQVPHEGLVFTNIENGVGLFSSRFERTVTGKSLSSHSIDSLAHGIYTKHLGFADSRNDYYYFRGE